MITAYHSLVCGCAITVKNTLTILTFPAEETNEVPQQVHSQYLNSLQSATSTLQLQEIFELAVNTRHYSRSMSSVGTKST